MMRFVPGFICLFLGGVLLALPNMSRRGLLFAVPVPLDFPSGRMGRSSIAQYRIITVIALLLVLGVLFLLPVSELSAAVIVSPFVVLGVSALEFLRQRRKISPFALQRTLTREAELSGEPENIPMFLWLAIGPFVSFGAVATYLHAKWSQIPAEFPVHWNTVGVADRFHARTTKGVYGPLFMGLDICVFLVSLGLAGWFGARRSRMRRTMLGVQVATEYILGILFSEIALMPIFKLPLAIVVVPPLIFVVVILCVATRSMSAMGEIAEPTPDNRWHLGLIYYNPDDPALFVEKRTGLGYTANLGNRWCWVLLGLTVAMIGSLFVFV